MPGPIIAVDSSRIRDRGLDELQAAMAELAGFVQQNEPRVIAYAMYLDERRSTMTVVQVHPDSESMELHMNASSHLFARFRDLVTLSAIDIYGEPSEELLALMRAKSRMLGGASLSVHALGAGFVSGTT